jgi:hypothetical protein
MELRLSHDCEDHEFLPGLRRMRERHNSRTRRPRNPSRKKSLKTELLTGKERADSILTRSDSLQQRPYICAVRLVTSSHFACGEAADHTFRMGDHTSHYEKRFLGRGGLVFQTRLSLIHLFLPNKPEISAEGLLPFSSASSAASRSQAFACVGLISTSLV